MPKVENVQRVRASTGLRAAAAIVVCIIFLIPILWMLLTAFKPQQDVIKVPPKVLFTPSLQGFVNLFFQRLSLPQSQMAQYEGRSDLNWWDQVALAQGQITIGPSQYTGRLLNSVIIATGSTLAAVAGTFLVSNRG